MLAFEDVQIKIPPPLNRAKPEIPVIYDRVTISIRASNTTMTTSKTAKVNKLRKMKKKNRKARKENSEGHHKTRLQTGSIATLAIHDKAACVRSKKKKKKEITRTELPRSPHGADLVI